jgi:hypothetical protein
MLKDSANKLLKDIQVVSIQCLKSTGNETERGGNITTDILISMSVMKV